MGVNIIEFNGIPGVGKSTLTENLKECLIKENYKILDEKDIYNQRNLLYKILLTFSMKNIKLNLLLFCLGIDVAIKNKKINPIINTFKIIRYNNILYKKINKEKYDFIILSEGIIQFLSVLFDNMKYSNVKYLKKVVKQIYKTNSNCLYVNCNIDINTAFERINNRDKEPNSINLMNKTILADFLMHREENLNFIRKEINIFNNSIDISTNIFVDKNIEKILKKISKGG